MTQKQPFKKLIIFDFDCLCELRKLARHGSGDQK